MRRKEERIRGVTHTLGRVGIRSDDVATTRDQRPTRHVSFHSDLTHVTQPDSHDVIENIERKPKKRGNRNGKKTTTVVPDKASVLLETRQPRSTEGLADSELSGSELAHRYAQIKLQSQSKFV